MARVGGFAPAGQVAACQVGFDVVDGEPQTSGFEVGGEQELLAEGSAVIARAGVPHGVRNESDSQLVLLVMMAPKPEGAKT